MQYHKIVELREKLKGYSTKSLSFPLPRQDANLERQKNSYSKVGRCHKPLRSPLTRDSPPKNTVPSPQPSQLSALEDWLRDFRGDNPFLQSNEAFTWADPNPSSYLCLSAPVKETGPCTTFITEKILRTYRHLLGHRVNTGQAVDTDTGHTLYSPSRISKASSLITTVLASTLPALAILMLNRQDSTDARIGVTAGFMALFALVISVFSDAKRIEVFAATATYVGPVSGIHRVND